MAVRATSADVEAICKVKSSITLTPFIAVANELVTELCSDSSYTAARLTKIETWLAAHFYRIRDMAVDGQKAGSVSQKFQYKVDLNLSVTMYGQTAMLIDTDGNLAALNESTKKGKRSLSVTWLGTGDDYGNDDTDDINR